MQCTYSASATQCTRVHRRKTTRAPTANDVHRRSVWLNKARPQPLTMNNALPYLISSLSVVTATSSIDQRPNSGNDFLSSAACREIYGSADINPLYFSSGRWREGSASTQRCKALAFPSQQTNASSTWYHDCARCANHIDLYSRLIHTVDNMSADFFTVVFWRNTCIVIFAYRRRRKFTICVCFCRWQWHAGEKKIPRKTIANMPFSSRKR